MEVNFEALPAFVTSYEVINSAPCRNWPWRIFFGLLAHAARLILFSSGRPSSARATSNSRGAGAYQLYFEGLFFCGDRTGAFFLSLIRRGCAHRSRL